MKVDLDEILEASKAATQGSWRQSVGLSGVVSGVNYESAFDCLPEDANLICLMRNNIDAMIEELKMYREAEFHAEQSALYGRKHNDDGSGNES